jgi:uncharacterized protein
MSSRHFRRAAAAATFRVNAAICIIVGSWFCFAASADTAQAVGEFVTIDPGRATVGGEIGRRIDVTIHKNLLAIDVENHFLKAFREKQNWPGCYVGIGKLIDATAEFARYCKDPNVLALKQRLVKELLATQLNDGYIGFMPPGERIFGGYDLHEMAYIIYALVDNYRWHHEQPSLDAARRLGDYILRGSAFAKLPDSTTRVNIHRAMIALSEATQDPRYRDFVVNGMNLRNWRPGVGGHVYQYINLCLAQLDLYRETPEERLLGSSRDVIEHLGHGGLTIMGTCGSTCGPSVVEHFGGDQETRRDVNENCATTYLIRLEHHLLQLEGKSLDGDLMERAIYNGLFAAQSPDGRRLRYFTCIDGPRVYFDKDSYCCPNNYRRIVAELPEMIYYRSKDGGVMVNLYTASSAEIGLAGDLTVRLRQETDYPNSGKVRIRVEPSRPARLPFMLRIPRWCESATVAINGVSANAAARPGTWCTINRRWNAGDVVTLDMPMKTRLVRGRKLQSGKVAVMRGPMVFCYNPSRQKTPLPAANLKLDLASLTGPVPDQAVRKDGIALQVRAWGPKSNRQSAADLTLLLTEFADPGGELTYWSVGNRKLGAEDELVVK